MRRLLLAAVLLAPVAAYNPPVDKAGPLTVRIDGPQAIDGSDVAVPLKVLLENAGAETLAGRLRLAGIDGWTLSPADAAPFKIPGHDAREFGFRVTPAPGSYNAHYPIHAYAELSTGQTAHAVLIIKAAFADAPRARLPIAWKPSEIAADSGFALWRTPVRRVVLQVFGSPARTVWLGSDGTDPETRSGAQFAVAIARGGQTRQAIAMHEPWAKGAGTIAAEYPLVLPNATPIKLRFANAMRDDPAGQAAGDGVTFRVRVIRFEAPDGQLGEIMFERHTNAKTWQDGEADLTRFAGQHIRLQLESHPGPRNDTTNDLSFWAEPTVIAGNVPAPRSAGQELRLPASDVYIDPGSRGLLDSTISFGHKLSFHGFQVRVLGDALEDWRSPAVLTGVHEESASGRYRVRHSFRSWAGTFDLVGELWVEKAVLRAHWCVENAPAPQPWLAVYVESAGAGPWSETASRVYAGDGNVLQDPAAFTLTFDGHRLSTSYAGFDFGNGLSMVEAVDVPPLQLDVDPKSRTYALRAAHEQTMTFIPAGSAWTAVKVWRDINGLHPAGGVGKLAGRFVFDLWGGNFEPSATALERSFRYGLKDAMVVWHNWQRWGYDYRLPEIFPPNPKSGSLESFAALAAMCKKNGVLFAPHDNYIDFYPDAENFSYDQIAFSTAGSPVKAWFNKGRDAQSYRWRADRLQGPMERNVTAIRDHVAPSAYFIDVWSSAGPYDYWTKDGAFHDRLSTRKVWADTFTWIRRTLGDNAPQISESGHDQLIGALDGAQTNHLRVDTPPPGEMNWTVWNIKAADAERVPWFDAAHHDRFVLHGAGYENRYAGGLDTAMHGIYSDDYITTEVLDGHPAMTPAPFGRDVVRKYWLLHDLMRALALARFESHEFAGGDLHRQHVRWEGGGEIWVNRGNDDWAINGHTLPQYGFFAHVPGKAGVVEAAIERRDGVIVEWSRSPEASYSNARPFVSSRLPLDVSLSGIEDLGGRQFRLTLKWKASGPIPEGYRILVHFTDAAGNILFQGDHSGPGSSGQWHGEFHTSVVVRIPEPVHTGQWVELRVGLYTGGGPRAQLMGLNDDERRLRLAAVQWTGSAVTGKALDQPANPFPARFNLEGRAIPFGGLTTNGAVRMSEEGPTILITPLPDGPGFDIRLRLAQAPRWVEAVNEGGEVVSRVRPRMEGGVTVVTRDPSVFAYRLIR